ncbi:hypothetical protein PR202_gb12873 [Eleusine coracana subsp. coracana]|uniref:Uncharacterized protein n=1 Tax=Eleusine coracana subsp. coracana TaxID=191504 RepID=A0AAV5ER51_ELECO|nr:hypothetical protein PR202_gb12873 [Eleusine coracana subsp. coracana]
MEATVTTTISLDRAPTQTFYVLIHQPSSAPENLWMPITGCVRPSQNSVCWNAPSTRRCYSPPNNSRALLAPGGQTMKLLCLLDAALKGMSSRLYFMLISSQLASCRGNFRNLWI